jgi:hypothetical protein
VGFDVTSQILIRSFALSTRQTLDKKWEYNKTVHKPFVDFKKAFDSVRRKYCTIFLMNIRYPWNYRDPSTYTQQDVYQTNFSHKK